jgi:hypothetical protein
LNNRSKIFFFLLLSPIVWVIVKVITTWKDQYGYQN